ncbi:hypothetical protein [Streptomyces sp. NPDC017260]|uniref:hypothetical protein n=1 Tax=unclassified Streptomyces TaxID=2593676 RepID=UPI003794CDBC
MEPGDVGLVMAVHGFLHDVGSGSWWVVCPGNRLYRLPTELNDWASRIDADVQRKFLNLPKVFAFSSIHGDCRVRILSMA